MANKLKIAFVASEVVPYAKTGGLADVAGALPKFLAEAGHDVRLFMPRYKKIDSKKFNLKNGADDLVFELGGRQETAHIYTAFRTPELPVYFFGNDGYFDRDELYGENGQDYSDNARRFAFFSKGVLELCKKLDFKPDVFHCHDWQTALIPTYLRTTYADDPFYKNTPVLFTIHNLAYQGLFDKEELFNVDLDWNVFTLETLEYYGKVAYIKGGLVFSDLINTVSQKYSKEIQTPEYGCGMEGLLSHRSKDLFGVVNGIDYDQWNPESDSLIAAKYSLQDLSGKKACKKALQEENNLPLKNVPLLGIISRLADQKGFDLIDEVIDQIMELDIQFVLLGTGEPKYHLMFERIKEKYPKKAGINLGFDAALAQRIYAGSDMFLMPSRYEPCGLGQLISLRYGTVPVVRRTGGLYDTIIGHPKKNANGFTFTDYKAKSLLKTVVVAVDAYKDKKTWQILVQNGMQSDFSWHASARKYISSYRKAIAKKKKVN